MSLEKKGRFASPTPLLALLFAVGEGEQRGCYSPSNLPLGSEWDCSSFG